MTEPTTDPELAALLAVVAALLPLTPAARRRVLAWAYARFVTDRDTVECRMGDDE